MKLIKNITVATLALTLGTTSMMAQEKWPEKLTFGVMLIYLVDDDQEDQEILQENEGWWSR